MDWTITVPLQMIEGNLILKATRKPVSAGMFWRRCSELSPSWPSATQERLVSWEHGWASALAWEVGSTSSKKSSRAKAGGVAGECSQVFKEAFKQGSCALHEHARVVGEHARENFEEVLRLSARFVQPRWPDWIADIWKVAH